MGNPSSILARVTPGPAPRQPRMRQRRRCWEWGWHLNFHGGSCSWLSAPLSWLLPALVPYLLCQLEPWRSCCWFNRSVNSPVQIQMKASPSQGGLVPGVSGSSPNSCMESWKGHFMILPTGLSHRCPSTHALLNSEFLKCQLPCHSYPYSRQRLVYSDEVFHGSQFW